MNLIGKKQEKSGKTMEILLERMEKPGEKYLENKE